MIRGVRRSLHGMTAWPWRSPSARSRSSPLPRRPMRSTAAFPMRSRSGWRWSGSRASQLALVTGEPAWPLAADLAAAVAVFAVAAVVFQFRLLGGVREAARGRGALARRRGAAAVSDGDGAGRRDAGARSSSAGTWRCRAGRRPPACPTASRSPPAASLPPAARSGPDPGVRRRGRSTRCTPVCSMARKRTCTSCAGPFSMPSSKLLRQTQPFAHLQPRPARPTGRAPRSRSSCGRGGRRCCPAAARAPWRRFPTIALSMSPSRPNLTSVPDINAPANLFSNPKPG